MDALKNRIEGKQRGFSLMETLLALAIMSMASLALFQSTASFLRLSERTIDSAFRAQDVAVLQKSFSQLVSGLIPAWSDEKKQIFIGTSTRFSGLTRLPYHTLNVGLTKFSLSLENDGVTSMLVYRSGSLEWVLQEFPTPNAQFYYLGADNVWRKDWPPKVTPEPGIYGDARFYKVPTFPLAIQLRAWNAKTNAGVVWLAEINDRVTLPKLEEF